MPELKRRTPCHDCPYRRKAAPGWLGASTPEGFMEQTLGAHTLADAMPCHTAIDYDDKDWRETQYPDAPVCVGSVQFLANTCKEPHGDLTSAVDAVGTNPNVFANHVEFLRHHTGDEDGVWMAIGCRVRKVQPDGSLDLSDPHQHDT